MPVRHLWVCNSLYATARVQTSPVQRHLPVVQQRLLLLTRPLLQLPLLLRQLQRVLLIILPTTPRVCLAVCVTVRPAQRTAIIPTVPDRSVRIRKKKVQSWLTKVLFASKLCIELFVYLHARLCIVGRYTSSRPNTSTPVFFASNFVTNMSHRSLYPQ